MDNDSAKQEQKEAAFIYNERSEKIGKKTSKNISAYFRKSIAKSSSEMQTYRLKCLKLLPKDIEYDECGTFFPNIILKMTRNTKNYQFIDVQVKWGFFRFKKITILTINKVSPLHDHQFYSGGNFSTVYSFRYQGAPLVCKCFERPQTFDEDSQLNILKNVIEEYCILKLASHLKVGPKVDQTMGYDIIVYFDCIEFSMQMCDQYSPKQHNKQAVNSDLLQNLAKLHSLHIIHHDIKYDNICYSRQFNKFVFIDFGFGRIIQEQVGFLTLTNYKGSLNHCSSEMVELFHSHQQKEIDLYYNDMNALKVALSEFQNRSGVIQIADEVQKDIDKLQESQYIYHHFFMYQLKYSLYHLEFDLLYQQDTLEEETIEELLNFVPSIYYSHKLKDACDWLLSKIQNRQFDKMQNNIFRLNYSNNNKIEELQEDDQVENETYMMLRSINNKLSIDYVLFKYEKQVDYLLKKYQDVGFLINVSFDQYCHFLAKAIEINSNNAKLQQLNNICEIAINNRSFFLKFNQKSTFPEGQGNYIMQVSFILFKKSIQKSQTVTITLSFFGWSTM